MKTRITASLTCEEALRWFSWIATAGIAEFKMIFEDQGMKETSLFAFGGGDMDDFSLVPELTPCRESDFSTARKDGTTVKFRWIGIRREGISSMSKLNDLNTLLAELAPHPKERFIFVCDSDAPFEAVSKLQRLIERTGCRPSAFVTE